MPRISQISFRRESYTMTSSPMFHTPGIVAWAQHANGSDPDRARDVIASGYPGLSADAVRKVIANKDLKIDSEASTVTVVAFSDPVRKRGISKAENELIDSMIASALKIEEANK